VISRDRVVVPRLSQAFARPWIDGSDRFGMSRVLQ
jgi:hypothetical protein